MVIEVKVFIVIAILINIIWLIVDCKPEYNKVLGQNAPSIKSIIIFISIILLCIIGFYLNENPKYINI